MRPSCMKIVTSLCFSGKAMVTWANERGVRLRLIQPGKPNQSAYIESINGRLRD